MELDWQLTRNQLKRASHKVDEWAYPGGVTKRNQVHHPTCAVWVLYRLLKAVA